MPQAYAAYDWFNKIHTPSLSSPRVSAKCRVLRPPRDAPSYDVAHGFWATLVAHRSFGEAGLLDGNGLVAAFLGWTTELTSKMLQQSAVRAMAYGLLWNQVAWRSHAASRSPTWVRGRLWSVRKAVLRTIIPQHTASVGIGHPPKKN